MNLNALKPVGPHITGFIRFAHEGEGDQFKQLDHFEILSRVHLPSDDTTNVPRLAQHEIAKNIKPGNAQEKLKAIPVKLMFDKPENNLRACYQAYDSELNRLACSGDGVTAVRADFGTGTTAETTCAGPEACEYANQAGVRCQLHVRLKVQIEGQSDPFAVFELQSSGINTYRTLSAKLAMMHAAFGGSLRNIPMTLAIYAKSSPLSRFEPFYVADLQLRDGSTMSAALESANAAKALEASLNMDAMEAAVEAMLSASPLALDDAETALIAFAPGVIDRAREPRRTARAIAAAPVRIENLVASARAASELPAENGQKVAIAPTSERVPPFVVGENIEVTELPATVL
ncbi:MAG: hypothetical protein Q7T63_00705 [Burkholderiaceae bacterium]|nr:hypothetical protein [Burkholderiaceae bacterium]MDP3135067.1 hypothetical protein [Burkholderiaceae bacterium]